MKAKILNLQGVVYDGEARAVNARTLSGEITVLDHHLPIITVLSANSRVWVMDEVGKRHDFDTPKGFLHLDGNNNLTVFID